MRIALIGAVEFSRRCLDRVLACGGEVVAVIGLDPAKAARHGDYANLAPLAARHGIPCRLVSNINAPETVEFLRAARPDVIFVFGWSQLIDADIRRLAPCIGTHPALLPRHRGRHPIIWALVEGLTESGLTFFYLDDGADSGDVVWQRPFAITADDDAGTLLEKIAELAEQAIAELLPQLRDGTAPRIPQDERLATYWRKRSAADGEIDWGLEARRLHNLVRALTHPYPGATTALDGVPVTIWRTRLMERGRAGTPGEILDRTSSGWQVATGDGTIEVIEYTTAREFSCGARLQRAGAVSL